MLVLAGGRAERMGGRKADRAWRTGTLLSHVVDVAQAVSDDVLIAAGSQREQLQALLDDSHALRWVDDAVEVDGEGPLGGLIGGLAAATQPWVWLLACDMPFVEPAALAPLVEACSPALDVIAYPGERGLEPFGALVSAGLADRAHAYAASGQRSLRGLFESAPRRILSNLPQTSAKQALPMLHNVNTHEELDAARRGDLASSPSPRRTSRR